MIVLPGFIPKEQFFLGSRFCMSEPVPEIKK